MITGTKRELPPRFLTRTPSRCIYAVTSGGMLNGGFMRTTSGRGDGFIETDAMAKVDRYVRLGMELDGTWNFGEYGKLYDMIRYPV